MQDANLQLMRPQYTPKLTEFKKTIAKRAPEFFPDFPMFGVLDARSEFVIPAIR